MNLMLCQLIWSWYLGGTLHLLQWSSVPAFFAVPNVNSAPSVQIIMLFSVGPFLPRTGCGAVMHHDSLVDFCQYKLFVCLLNFLVLSSLLIYFLAHLLPGLVAPSRIYPFHFQAGCCRKQRKLALFFVLRLCCTIFGYGFMIALVVFDLVFQY